MKTKIAEVFADNGASKWGVWIDNGRTVYGRSPLAKFDSKEEAQAFAASLELITR